MPSNKFNIIIPEPQDPKIPEEKIQAPSKYVLTEDTIQGRRLFIKKVNIESIKHLKDKDLIDEIIKRHVPKKLHEYVKKDKSSKLYLERSLRNFRRRDKKENKGNIK